MKTIENKWYYLEHKGPVFPHLYTRLPTNVNLIYNEQPIKLEENAKEAACLYTRLLQSKHVSDPVFIENFLNDGKATMTVAERKIITNLQLCNFKQINLHIRKMKGTLDRKLAEVKLQQQIERHKTCFLNDQTQTAMNVVVSPPALIISKSNAAKERIRKRVHPSDITINCSSESVIPIPPYGTWKDVVEKQDVLWLAKWNNIDNESRSSMRLDESTEIVQVSERAKYEKARTYVHPKIGKIREQYMNDCASDDIMRQEWSICLYIFDVLCFRHGGSSRYNDTMGSCNLKARNVTLSKDNIVAFNFVGKAGIHYVKEATVPADIYNTIAQFVFVTTSRYRQTCNEYTPKQIYIGTNNKGVPNLRSVQQDRKTVARSETVVWLFKLKCATFC